MEDLTGKWFDKYQIISAYGQGGMANIYKAYQASVDRYVALKVLPRQYANDPQFVGRFKQEARIVASLQHPHILPVFDYGEADGYTYLVMPLVEGGTLGDYLKGSPISYAETERIISQLCDALEYAHSQGLVHRDVKPSNILLDERGNCLLSDFGITKIIEGTAQFTQTGGFVGTPIYMSPEQGLGQKLDGRSDIYSLGIILYQMITGRVPYDAETPIAVVYKHINDPLPLPRQIDPSIPESVERVLLKSLAKNPEDRYASATQLSEALRTALHRSEEKTFNATPFDPHQTVIEAQEASGAIIQPGTIQARQPLHPDTAQENHRNRNYLIVGLFSIVVVSLFCIVGFLIFNTLLNRTSKVAELTLPAPTDNAQLNPTAINTLPEGVPLSPPSETPGIPSSTPQNLVITPTPEPSVTAALNLTLTSTADSVDGAALILVPAGEFLMGSDPEEPYFWGAETPKHAIYLDAFWVYSTEVTNAMYGECVAANACPMPIETGSRTHSNYYGNPTFADYPVIYVTYSGAESYCEWAGGRLPTEAEWEKAARGTDGRLFPWGNEPLSSTVANFCDIGCPNPDEIEAELDDGYRDVAPVGSFPTGASPYGALDMAGNVLEWVSDWYSQTYYASSPYENPTGAANGTRHPIRGGSWFSGHAGLRPAARASLAPDTGYDTLGFRCVVDEK